MAQTASSLRLRRPPSLRRGTNPALPGSRQRRFWPHAPGAPSGCGPGTRRGFVPLAGHVFTACRVKLSAAVAGPRRSLSPASSISSRPSSRLIRKVSLLGLDRCLQRRAFRRQLPPQLEGDLGQAGVGLGYRFDQILEFVFGLSVNDGSHEGVLAPCVPLLGGEPIPRNPSGPTSGCCGTGPGAVRSSVRCLRPCRPSPARHRQSPSLTRKYSRIKRSMRVEALCDMSVFLDL